MLYKENALVQRTIVRVEVELFLHDKCVKVFQYSFQRPYRYFPIALKVLFSCPITIKI